MKKIIILLPFIFLLISCAEQGEKKSTQGEDSTTEVQTEAVAGDETSPENGDKASQEGTDGSADGSATGTMKPGKSSANTLVPHVQTNQATKPLSPKEKEDKKATRDLFIAGSNHLTNNRYAEGIEAFNEYIEIDQGNSRAYYNRGLGYYHLQMYNEASDDFSKALELNENDSISALHLGLVKYYKLDYQGALDQ